MYKISYTVLGYHNYGFQKNEALKEIFFSFKN